MLTKLSEMLRFGFSFLTLPNFLLVAPMDISLILVFASCTKILKSNDTLSYDVNYQSPWKL